MKKKFWPGKWVKLMIGKSLWLTNYKLLQPKGEYTNLSILFWFHTIVDIHVYFLFVKYVKSDEIDKLCFFLFTLLFQNVNILIVWSNQNFHIFHIAYTFPLNFIYTYFWLSTCFYTFSSIKWTDLDEENCSVRLSRWEQLATIFGNTSSQSNNENSSSSRKDTGFSHIQKSKSLNKNK
jgi:hypothetical protein